MEQLSYLLLELLRKTLIGLSQILVFFRSVVRFTTNSVDLSLNNWSNILFISFIQDEVYDLFDYRHFFDYLWSVIYSVFFGGKKLVQFHVGDF